MPDDLLAQAKQRAAERNTTLTAVINDAVREVLARHHASDGEAARIQLVTFSGGGPLPGVDLDDSAALIDLMESGGAAD